MKPIEFEEHNVVFAKDQPQYLPLPGFYNRESVEGEVITCWKLSWKELLQVLWTRKVWLSQLTFHKPLQPQRPQIEKPI